jgi:SM-20-related protein
MKFLEELKKALNENFFLGLKQYECHLASYPAGSFYQKHSDRFEASSSRYLSFVFYLNESWEPDYGGTLVLYEKNGSPIDTIFPLPGSFICFLSEDFPHEVQAAKFERRSLTGWMHNKLIY